MVSGFGVSWLVFGIVMMFFYFAKFMRSSVKVTRECTRGFIGLWY